MDNNIKEWLEYAEADLGSAQYLYDHYYKKPLHIICYHAQQAAEKALKAVIIANGAVGGMPKMHDLEFLLNQMKNYANIKVEFYDYADVLTPYGVSIRYPGEIELSDGDAKEALQYATEILIWAKEEIYINK